MAPDGQAALKPRGKQGYWTVMIARPRNVIFALLLMVAAAPAPAVAEEAEVPYWAALRADEVNMRVGPGEDYRILWVYRRKQLPLRVIRLKEGWRLVEDPDGARGWMIARFLTRERGAIVKGPGLAEMREKADPASRLKWRIEPGASGRLGECEADWCELEVAGHKGFVPQSRLWGAGEP